MRNAILGISLMVTDKKKSIFHQNYKKKCKTRFYFNQYFLDSKYCLYNLFSRKKKMMKKR